MRPCGEGSHGVKMTKKGERDKQREEEGKKERGRTELSIKSIGYRKKRVRYRRGIER